MSRVFGAVLIIGLVGCGGNATQRVSYPGAVKGNRVVGRYFGTSTTAAFHHGDEGVVAFDGTNWTPVPGLDANASVLRVLSAGGGKLWVLTTTKLERVDAAGMREDFTSQLSGQPISLGVGNGTVLVCAHDGSAYAVYKFEGGSFQKTVSGLTMAFDFELVRTADDAIVGSMWPELSLQVMPNGPMATNYGFFDGKTVYGPLSTLGDASAGLTSSLRATSPRLPPSMGVFGDYVFDGAWLHPSRRPPPSGFFYLRSDGRLGVLANLYGEGGIAKAYGVTYDPVTGQSTTTLLDVNGDAEVTWTTAAWDGVKWVDEAALFKASACIGATCGGSRTGFVGELDDGTLVAAGNENDVSGIWFIKP